MANLGANLWEHAGDGKTACIRAGRVHYVARCQSRSHCAQRAVIQIECRDSIGHPLLNRDYCEAHSRGILNRAEERGIAVSWF
jgi:hypothetical protein